MKKNSPKATPTPAYKDTAGTAIVGTTEILEMILVLLDMKTLLLAQRVSKKFMAVIKQNSQLQKRLFFLPASLEEAFELCATENEDGFELFYCRDRNASFGSSYHERVDNPELSQLCVVNPLLFLANSKVYGIGNLEYRRRLVNLRHLGARRDIRTNVVEPSWRRMLLAQPSLRQLDFGAQMGRLKKWTSHDSMHTRSGMRSGCSNPFRHFQGRDFRYGRALCRTYDALIIDTDSVNTATLRLAQDQIETKVMEDHGGSVKWSESWIAAPGESLKI